MFRRCFILVILVSSCYASLAFATCTGLGCSCSVSATALGFGTYDPQSNTDATMNSTVSVTCNALVLYSAAYSIALGTGSSSTYTARTLTHSGHTINYNLYTTNGLSTVWGDGTASTGTISDSYSVAILQPTTRDYTVFGMIPKLQNAFVGTPYTDSIGVTVTY